MDSGVAVADPLEFLKRVNSEASENVEETFSANNNALDSESTLWSKLLDELTLDKPGRLIKEIGERASEHFKRINAHELSGDVANNLPICQQDVAYTSKTNIEERGFYNCDNIKTLDVTSSSGTFTVNKWAFYGATNLATITLPGDVDVKEMAFRNIGSGREINFKSQNYATIDSTTTYNSIITDSNAVSSGTTCNIKCDADYSTTWTATAANCGTGVLDQASCDFDNTLFALQTIPNDKTSTATPQVPVNDGTASRFLTKTITRDTIIECASGNTGVKVMELTMPANCGRLQFGDLRLCTGLTHIYITKDAGCALSNLFTSTIQSTVLELLWSNDVTVVDKFKAYHNALPRDLAFGVNNAIKQIGGSSATADGELCSGTVTVTAASASHLLKLPFATTFVPTETQATATYDCVVSATNSTARTCADADVNNAETGHSGFTCAKNVNKVDCVGGTLDSNRGNYPTGGASNPFNSAASCLPNLAVPGNDCAFGGTLQKVTTHSTSPHDIGFQCVAANNVGNATVDDSCTTADVTLAATAHYGLTCAVKPNVDATCKSQSVADPSFTTVNDTVDATCISLTPNNVWTTSCVDDSNRAANTATTAYDSANSSACIGDTEPNTFSGTCVDDNGRAANALNATYDSTSSAACIGDTEPNTFSGTCVDDNGRAANALNATYDSANSSACIGDTEPNTFSGTCVDDNGRAANALNATYNSTSSAACIGDTEPNTFSGTCVDDNGRAANALNATYDSTSSAACIGDTEPNTFSGTCVDDNGRAANALNATYNSTSSAACIGDTEPNTFSGTCVDDNGRAASIPPHVLLPTES